MSEIIVYYSRSGNNYVSGAIKNLAVGNTEMVAEKIRELTGADIFKIESVEQYSADYSECIAQAMFDQQRNARPQLIAYPDNFDQYNTVYLGYPNYWGTMPMPVFTFLEQYNLSGKHVKLFCTHEGNEFGNSEQDIARLWPDAVLEVGPAIRGCHINEIKIIIEQWLLSKK